MMCGIVKMHYRSWRTRSSVVVQDLRERLKHLLTEAVAVELVPAWEPVNEDGAVAIWKHSEDRFVGRPCACGSCRHLIERHTPYLPVIVGLQKR
jgi:hypothetical protein